MVWTFANHQFQSVTTVRAVDERLDACPTHERIPDARSMDSVYHALFRGWSSASAVEPYRVLPSFRLRRMLHALAFSRPA